MKDRGWLGGLDMSRSVAGEEICVRISCSLQRKLSLYALAAGAAGVEWLALANPAEAEVVYTPAHQVIGRNQGFPIDLNHDGVTDFTIQNHFRENSSSEVAILEVGPGAGGSVVYSNFGLGAAALQRGTRVGPRSPFKGGLQIMADRYALSFAGTTYHFGSWFNVSNGYLGIQFSIDGQVHFGWARLTTRSNGKFLIVATLTGYAYETDPGKAIIAGDIGNGSDEEKGRAEPPSRVPQQQGAQPGATLGALSLGAPGISTWRQSTPHGS
jgi:hypothetical protein